MTIAAIGVGIGFSRMSGGSPPSGTIRRFRAAKTDSEGNKMLVDDVGGRNADVYESISVLNGVNSSIAVGTGVTILSSKGTSILTLTDGVITGTKGTVYNIELSDGRLIPCPHLTTTYKKVGDTYELGEPTTVNNVGEDFSKTGNPYMWKNGITHGRVKDTTGIYAYNDDESNVKKYGRLYTLQAATNCQTDEYRLPSDEQLKQLELFIGMTQEEVDAIGWRGDVADKLKAVGFGSGTDNYGFGIVGGGVRRDTGGYTSLLSTGLRTQTELYRYYYSSQVGILRNSAWLNYSMAVRYLHKSPATEPSGTKGTTVIDGYEYKTIVIDTQLWLAENFRGQYQTGVAPNDPNGKSHIEGVVSNGARGTNKIPTVPYRVNFKRTGVNKQLFSNCDFSQGNERYRHFGDFVVKNKIAKLSSHEGSSSNFYQFCSQAIKESVYYIIVKSINGKAYMTEESGGAEYCQLKVGLNKIKHTGTNKSKPNLMVSVKNGSSCEVVFFGLKNTDKSEAVLMFDRSDEIRFLPSARSGESYNVDEPATWDSSELFDNTFEDWHTADYKGFTYIKRRADNVWRWLYLKPVPSTPDETLKASIEYRDTELDKLFKNLKNK